MRDNKLAFDEEGNIGWVAKVGLGTRGLEEGDLIGRRESELWEKKDEADDEVDESR